MAYLRTNLPLWLALVLAAPLWTHAAADSAAREPAAERCNQPANMTFARLQGQRNHVVAEQVEIIYNCRGGTRIKADKGEGNGLDVGTSRWVLTGHVQVFMAQGTVSADEATIRLENKRVVTITGEGSPAQFERTAQSPSDLAPHARARARSFRYDLARNEVELDGDTWLFDGCNEITGGHIRYDIANQSFQADAAPGDRVHGIIRSRDPGQCPTDAAATP